MICDYCMQEMSDPSTDSCEHALDLSVVPPNSRLRRCHDCNVKPGGTHHPGCDMEHCSVCGVQIIMGCIDSRNVAPDVPMHDADRARWLG